MVAGDGCQGFGQPNGPANDNSVFCPTNDIQRISATLGDGEDEFSAGNALPMTVYAGPGDDEVETGPGPDVVLGGAGDDVLDLDTNASPGTSSEVNGGADDDELRIGRDSRATLARGGPGRDTATYRFASGARTVTIDNVANDGGAGEGDDVRTDVEVVIGGNSGDSLTGSGNGETLDGAGGTDTLIGLDGPDTLIGGPGVNDSTSGGPGDDAIMLRDGERDACPNGGPGTNTFDLDLVNQQRVGFGGFFLRLCFFTIVPVTAIVDFGAVNEGPNVRMTVLRPAVSRAGVRVRLACPAVLRKPCAGPLRVFTFRGRRALAAVTYSIRPGRAETVVLPLNADARQAVLATPALRIVSVEKGRSKLGPRRPSAWSGREAVQDDSATEAARACDRGRRPRRARGLRHDGRRQCPRRVPGQARRHGARQRWHGRQPRDRHRALQRPDADGLARAPAEPRPAAVLRRGRRLLREQPGQRRRLRRAASLPDRGHHGRRRRRRARRGDAARRAGGGDGPRRFGLPRARSARGRERPPGLGDRDPEPRRGRERPRTTPATPNVFSASSSRATRCVSGWWSRGATAATPCPGAHRTTPCAAARASTPSTAARAATTFAAGTIAMSSRAPRTTTPSAAAAATTPSAPAEVTT